MGSLLVQEPVFKASFHSDGWFALLFAPNATGAASLAYAQWNLSAVHAENGVVILGHLLGVAHNVVADKGAAETVFGGVGEAAVHYRAVEEEHIAGVHNHGAYLASFRQGHGNVGEAHRGVGLNWAEDGPEMAAGNHLHAPVLFIAGVKGKPCGHAGAGLHPQIELILMERLAACPGRLEIEHGLHGVRLFTHKGG